MRHFDPEVIAAYVETRTRRRPDAAAAARMAATASAVANALEVLAADPLMDTEPSNLEQVLAELAEPADALEVTR